MAAMSVVLVRVSYVAEAHAHIADDGVGQRDRDGDAEDRVSDSEWIEITVAKEEETCG